MNARLVVLVAFHLACGAHGITESGCDPSKCRKTGLYKYYSEVGCTPVYGDESCCPIKYDCSQLSERNNDKCHYQGTEYDIQTQLPTNMTNRNCLASCGCYSRDDKVSFVCAQIECAELFLGPLRDPACFRQFSHDSCCSTNTFCFNNTSDETKKDLYQCEYDGKKFYKGQKFYVKDECKTCICDEGYDGSSDEPWCKEFQCSVELRRQDSISQGCVPVFFNAGCCPIEWICPSANNTIIHGPLHKTPITNSENNNEQLTCSFGNLRLYLHDKLSQEDNKKVECACLVPPFLTCTLHYP